MLSNRECSLLVLWQVQETLGSFYDLLIKEQDKHEIDSMQVMKFNLAISENKAKSKKKSKLSKERHKTHFPQIGKVEKCGRLDPTSLLY